MKRILVAGSSNIDMVVHVQHLPGEGETVAGSSLERLCGGKGANQAYACGMLGANTVFLSVVGGDGTGELIVDNMRRAGVDCSRMRVEPSASTGTAFICVNDRGNNSIVVTQGANGLCDRAFFERNLDALDECDVLLIQLETPAEGVWYLVEQAHSRGKTVVLNPAPAPDAIPEQVYPMLDWITPNETELAHLTGMPVEQNEDVRRAAETLLKKGVGGVLVTLGGKGALLMTKDEALCCAPPDVPVRDTTAAGDTFNAAFLTALCEGACYERAMHFANAASSLTVSRAGAQASIPARAEVDAFLEQLNGKGDTLS